MSKKGANSRLNTYLTSIQQEATLSWANTRSGPPGEEKWTCICKINGEERGRGVSKKQSDAKDIASDAALAFLTGASGGGST